MWPCVYEFRCVGNGEYGLRKEHIRQSKLNCSGRRQEEVFEDLKERRCPGVKRKQRKASEPDTDQTLQDLAAQVRIWDFIL